MRLMRDSTKELDSKFELGPAINSLLELKMWPFMVLRVAYGVATISTVTFLLQIVAHLGYTTIKTNLFLVAPILTSCVITLVVAWLSDHYQERGAFLCLGFSLTMIGYIMAERSSSPPAPTFRLVSSTRGTITAKLMRMPAH
ncbi:hypothetical protein BJX63DRAFT_415959 [Aspergillus granulosus]|uniref:WAT1-related protein n=1 Tax=Aspergillus granulosus TaxID=176169 RepID=A0ABR4GSN1_9EURO